MRRSGARIQDRFVDADLRLAVVEAMIRQGLVVTDLRIPEPEPDEDDDPDDESESWRDRIDEDEMAVRAALHDLLDAHADKLARIEEIDDVFIEVHADTEQFAEIDSLAGIELCTGLRRLTFTTDNKKLDLGPLTALPQLEELNFGASPIRDLGPLRELGRLRSLTGRVDARTAAALRERGVTVTVVD
jgi:hypothetical protein